jgi:hypothetical protein
MKLRLRIVPREERESNPDKYYMIICKGEHKGHIPVLLEQEVSSNSESQEIWEEVEVAR